MITIGLTGGIGMGKSTTASFFAELGVPVWNADSAVHRLYAPGGFGVGPVLARFPSAGTPEEGINRAQLAEAVLGKPEELKALEDIVHPLVGADQLAFRDTMRAEGAEMVVFDIPLLLENLREPRPDYIVVCSAPEETRKARVMDRPGMTAEKYAAIIAAQMPEEEKRVLADYIVPTGESFEVAREAVRKIVEDIRAKSLDADPEQTQD